MICIVEVRTGAIKKASNPCVSEAMLFQMLIVLSDHSAASVSPAGTASSESPIPPLTSMKLRRRLSSNARRRLA
jgi:hypothetical protein